MATGAVSPLAGSGGRTGDSDGSDSRFRNPQGVAVTPDGSTAVVADSGNHKIRLVNMSTGWASTLAGSGVEGSQDWPSGSASFRNPGDVKVTPDGSKAVVADGNNNKIRLVDMATGAVSTLAGSGYRDKAGFFDCADYPGVAVTPDGSKAVVSDWRNNKIRLVDMATGVVSTLAGSGEWFSFGVAQDGVAGNAIIENPFGVAMTPDGRKAVVTHWGSCSDRLDSSSCPMIRLVDVLPTCVVCEVLFCSQLFPNWAVKMCSTQ